MYKLASATRHDRVVYDLMGPWYIEGTNWPDLHCELRAQCCAGYSDRIASMVVYSSLSSAAVQATQHNRCTLLRQGTLTYS